MFVFLALIFCNYLLIVNSQRKIHYISESPCDDNPCLYGGSCHHVKDSVAYLCHCTGGHWGRHCEFAAGLKPCAHHQCQSGSTCKPDAGHDDHYKCLCRSGQSGKYCNVTAMEVVGTMACEKKCGGRY
uniref:EGF-like domain-containing protein n=1 Tax=Romanomermis culicivorax TaxID=13658 RepID=A0A915IKX0_ROMCU